MLKLVAVGLVGIVALNALPASAQVFQGPYVGAQAGWNRDSVDAPRTDAGVATINDEKDSFIGGAFVGYNQTVTPNIVLGVEGSFNVTASDDVRRNGASINPDYSFDLSARAGYLIGGKTLIYARGGYENMRAKVRVPSASGLVSNRDTFDGWTVGGGVERALLDKVSARLEYRYSDLGSNGQNFDRHQVLVGVGYHF